MKKEIVVGTVVSILLFNGCAKKAEEIKPAYVSPIQYQNLDCTQLESELSRVSVKVAQVADIQNKNHKRDVVATTVGTLVFWPALFFLAAGDQEEELKRLKGEYEALQTASIRKNCSFMQKKVDNNTTGKIE